MRLLFVSAVLVLALTACKPVWDPTFMPSGYAHHNKEYKTPPGPEAETPEEKRARELHKEQSLKPYEGITHTGDYNE